MKTGKGCIDELSSMVCIAGVIKRSKSALNNSGPIALEIHNSALSLRGPDLTNFCTFAKDTHTLAKTYDVPFLAMYFVLFSPRKDSCSASFLTRGHFKVLCTELLPGNWALSLICSPALPAKRKERPTLKSHADSTIPGQTTGENRAEQNNRG